MTVERLPIPPEMLEKFRAAREAIIEAAADFDDTILADFIDGIFVEPTRLRMAIRKGTIASRLFPVFLGAALRNKGVQPLLDAVGDYLPSPLDVPPAIGMPSRNRSLGGSPLQYQGTFLRFGLQGFFR